MVRRRFDAIWTMGGLSLADLLYRTARESWEDSVFGQGGRMALYHFLAIFPSLLVFLTITARVPQFGHSMQRLLRDLAIQVFPDQVSPLFQSALDELRQHVPTGIRLVVVCAGASWASFNATWAMIYGLNRAYEVQERRSWWKLALTIVGLTLALGAIFWMSLFVIVVGIHAGIPTAAVEWAVLLSSLAIWFGLLYRFAPNLRDHEWRWSTPGSVCALVLWIGAALAARFYFDRVDNYSLTFGHLNGVAMLLLWLYVSNGAILIGGEMNSEIRKAEAKRAHAPVAHMPATVAPGNLKLK